MTKRRIEIILKNIQRVYVERLLLDFFYKSKSLDFPVHILFDVSTSKSDVPGYVDAYYDNWRIVEASNNEEEPSRELAKIIIQSYPSHVVILIEGEDGDDWAKVENLTRKIIDKAKLLFFEIISVEPKVLIPPSSLDDNGVSITEDHKPKRRAGRPSHPDDIWAWQQVNELLRPVPEVKKEWMNRPGVIARAVTDPDRAFRNAVDPKKPKSA